MLNYKRYQRNPVMNFPERTWPNNEIEKAPVWCSVDLRDGNQALIDPMVVSEKIELFQYLVRIGFKEIEVGFPAASQIEYDFLRELVDRKLIPDDVKVQVLTQCREELIDRTFDAIAGCPQAIVHIYNSTSTLQRDVVFGKNMEEIKQIAIEGTRMVKERAASFPGKIILEYSPESYTGTEPEYALEVCEAVLEEWGATKDNKVIINLPSTVEMTTPNVFADRIEWTIKNFKNRESVIVSIHPHNDRGEGVATAELALLAGADRVEGTLFGNGERTGNLDIVTVALNMFTQNVDPKLEFSNIMEIRQVYEDVTKMTVPPRQPYAGELAFTAFSGSHQDAIRKGYEYMKTSGTEYWEVPYLPINPADLNRQYEPVIRINSQSGKGGAVYVLEAACGYRLPKSMHPDFGNVIKAAADAYGDELTSDQIVEIFHKEYIDYVGKYNLKRHRFFELNEADGTIQSRFEGAILVDGDERYIAGNGNGPIDSFFQALDGIGVHGYSFINYHEHAVSEGSDSKGICYIELANAEGKHVFGVGIHNNINVAALLGIINAINRAERVEE